VKSVSTGTPRGSTSNSSGWHGLHDPATNVSNDDPHVTARIALAHLNEFPDTYTRLERMEAEAKRDWDARPGVVHLGAVSARSREARDHRPARRRRRGADQ
jgi:hypothetical protein